MTMAHAMGHVAMPDHGRTDHPEGQHGRAEMPCAFAGLSAAMLAAVDPIQWVALLAFVLATGFVAITATVRPARPICVRPSEDRPRFPDRASSGVPLGDAALILVPAASAGPVESLFPCLFPACRTP